MKASDKIKLDPNIMVLNMVYIGVYAKKRKNVVKEELKYLHQLKS